MSDPAHPFDPFPPLTTPRLHLRQLAPADVPALYTILSCEKVAQHLDVDTFQSEEEAADLVRFLEQARERGKAIRWGITLNSTGAVIGTCGYHRLSPHDRRAEIGYELHIDYWGKGIMREALRAMLHFGFQTMHLHRIEALVNPDNVASRSLLRSLGFKEEGLLRDYAYFRGRFNSLKIFSLLKEEST
jgi:ribosomal-protein-alanine N-acetyltransferase